ALHVLTSRHEAFGMVVTEAAACGLPTVGFALGVLNEFHDAQAGIAGPPGDVDALVIAIRDLLGDRERLASMRDRARQLVESQYTVAAMANGMKQIYTQLQYKPNTKTRS
ncbi:MAG: glycosyltransferase family 4 protein, partial [Chloroflexota bacterium]